MAGYNHTSGSAIFDLKLILSKCSTKNALKECPVFFRPYSAQVACKVECRQYKKWRGGCVVLSKHIDKYSEHEKDNGKNTICTISMSK